MALCCHSLYRIHSGSPFAPPAATQEDRSLGVFWRGRVYFLCPHDHCSGLRSQTISASSSSWNQDCARPSKNDQLLSGSPNRPWKQIQRMAAKNPPADFLRRSECQFSQNRKLPNRLTAEKFQISQRSGCRRLPPADVCLG